TRLGFYGKSPAARFNLVVPLWRHGDFPSAPCRLTPCAVQDDASKHSREDGTPLAVHIKENRRDTTPGRLDMAERRERYSRTGKKGATSETFREQQQVVKHTETTASELLSEAQAGNRSAFERLVERHRDDVYGLALQMTRSEICALNIAQKSFLSAGLHLNEF